MKLTLAILLTLALCRLSAGQEPTPALPDIGEHARYQLTTKLRSDLQAITRHAAHLEARLAQLEPADNLKDWLHSILAGQPRTLAPGVYTLTETVTIYRRHGLVFRGPARNLMDPVGVARAWWLDNHNSRCIIIGDLPAGEPLIKLVGCESCLFEGINFCRTTPGAIITDSNAAGLNSGGHLFRSGSFYARWRHASALPDPLKGVAIVEDKTGHYGLGVYGTNGCDNYTFERWRFENLDRGVDVDCPQTTRLAFRDSWWERCNHMAWLRRSGNVLATNCTRYSAGPFVLQDCPYALTSVTWVGSWSDRDGAGVAKSGMQPLVDFSRNPTGRLTLIGGNGRKVMEAPEDGPPLVIPPANDGRLVLVIDGPHSQGQPVLRPEKPLPTESE